MHTQIGRVVDLLDPSVNHAGRSEAQRARPDVACGLKRGFTFLFHQPYTRFTDGPRHDHQLMVAASPRDEIADTHWCRPDFDHALVREAEAGGVRYLDETRLERGIPFLPRTSS
jgi:FADH2 O2-dependent halogenase